MKTRLILAVFILVLLLPSSRAASAPDEFIVTLKHGQSVEGFNGRNSTHTIRQIAGNDLYLVATDDPKTTLDKIKKDNAVDDAEKNVHIKLTEQKSAPVLLATLNTVLTQAMATLLDGNSRSNFFGADVLKAYAEQPALDIMRVTPVRSVATGVATRVGFIDTGVDPSHPALAPWLDPGIDVIFNRTASEFDGLSQAMASLLDQAMTSLLDQRFSFVLNQAMASLLDDGQGSTSLPPAFGHGTMVAGLIHVVAPQATLVPIKAFDAEGGTTTFTLIDAVNRARDLNLDVLNLSFSTSQSSEALRKAIQNLWKDGTVVVASVGNDASDSPLYPAGFSNVYGVAATGFDDKVAGFSNYGSSVSLTAPGMGVVSTFPGGHYVQAWGTSFSAPLASGAFAVLAAQRSVGHSDSAMIITNADSVDGLNPGFKGKLGKGRINVQKALGKN